MKQIVFLGMLCLFAATAVADRVTPETIQTLAASEQPLWRDYLQRSQTNAALDQAVLAAEVKALGWTNAQRAPSGGDFKLPAPMGDPYYASDAARDLAAVLLSYQTPSGGWSKHNGYHKGPRRPGMQFTSQNEPHQPSHYVATFDNRATTEELHFLAAVAQETKQADVQKAFRRGVEFVLAAQYPNGGWPQVYPLEGGYHDQVTFNDSAMTRILEFLQAIDRGATEYKFLDAPLRSRVAAALQAGIRCVLRTQVEQAGHKTVWCAQYDPLTLQPAVARKFEPAALSGMESVDVLKFLMSIRNPSDDVVAAIEGGLAWFEKFRITGMTRTKLNGKTAFEPKPESPEIYWARFYDLATNKPLFPGRDGVIYDSFHAMAANNDLGYDYFTTQPGSLIRNGQKKWRKQMGDRPANSAKRPVNQPGAHP